MNISVGSCDVRRRLLKRTQSGRQIQSVVATFAMLASFVAHAVAPLPPLTPPTTDEQKACAKPGRTPAEVQVCVSPQVWARAVVGAMQTGVDNQSRPAGRIFHVLVVGPGYETVNPRVAAELRKSLQHLTANKVAAVLVRQVDRTVSPSQALEASARKNPHDPSKVTPEALAGHSKASANEVFEAVQGAAINYQSTTRALFKDRDVDWTKFRMAISESACLPSEGCDIPQWALDDSNMRFHRYSKLLNWQRQRTDPPRQLYGFVAPGVDTLFAAGAMDGVRKVPASAVTPDLQLRNFERLVNDVRREGPRYRNGFNLNSSVPSVLNLSKRSALAVVDLLDSPVTAIHQLEDVGQGELSSISDELARARIADCTRLRGNITPADISACSGYELTAPQEVAECMTGRRCFPKVGKELMVDALLLVDPKDIRTLVTGVALPRIRVADDINQLKTSINGCTAASRGSTSLGMIECLTEQRAPKEAATFKCARAASELKGAAQTAKLRECLSDNLSPDQRKQLDCYTGAREVVDRILCTSKEKLSPQARAVAECIEEARADKRGKQQMEVCLLSKNVPGAQKVLACFKGQADWKRGLACSMKDEVGGDVGKALDCAVQTNYKPEEAAVCMVKLPGDLGKAAQCFAQSGGDHYGAAVCGLAGGMTVDQRIALQCAAQSRGEPTTFATCLVGQMTMKELAHCKGMSFGEGKCFNENNEFRKIFAQAGLPIGRNSVVANVINVHLKYLEAQVTLFSDLNEGAKEALTQVSKVMNESYRAVLRAHEDLVKGTVGTAKNACSGLAKALFGKKKRC